MLCTCVLSLRIVSAAGVQPLEAAFCPWAAQTPARPGKYKEIQIQSHPGRQIHTGEYTRVQIHSNPCGQKQVWEIQIANLVIDNSQKI